MHMTMGAHGVPTCNVTYATDTTSPQAKPQTHAQAPMPAHEHALAITLLRAFPGAKAADDGTLQAYENLGESLILGLVGEAAEAAHSAATREVILTHALGDLQKQPRSAAIITHLHLLQLLHAQGHLRHVKAAMHLGRLQAMQRAVPPSRYRAAAMSALGDALLGFVLAEASS